MSEELKPPSEKKRPIMLGFTWAAAVYSFVLVAYAQYWQWLHPHLTHAQVCKEFELWMIPAIIVFLCKLYIGTMMTKHIGVNMQNTKNSKKSNNELY